MFGLAGIDLPIFLLGYAACWFSKDWAIQKWKGVEQFVADLKAKAAALEAKAAAVKDAVTK